MGLISFIKDKLDAQYGSIRVPSTTSYRRPALQSRKDNFKTMTINDKKGEFLDLSMIFKILTLIKKSI